MIISLPIKKATRRAPPRALTLTAPLALTLALTASCTKSERANEVTLSKVCMKAAKDTILPSTLQRLEMTFFADKRARGLLAIDKIKMKSMREVSSSATLGTYELIFEFTDQKGAVLVLRNDDATGGVALDGPNQVMFRGVCEVQWSHFKGRPFQKSFSVNAVSLDGRLRALDVE